MLFAGALRGSAFGQKRYYSIHSEKKPETIKLSRWKPANQIAARRLDHGEKLIRS